MKQPYAKLMAAMWSDESDFRFLPALAQRAYLVLISQPNMSNCGVLPYAVRRWARMAPDTSVPDFEASLRVLQDEAYVVVDEDSEELWVRTWMKYDRLMDIHNGPKGVARSIEAVLSTSLKNTIRSAAFELAPDSQRSLFVSPCEAPSQPPPQGRRNYSSSNNNTNYDNNSSAPPADVDPVDSESDAAAADSLVDQALGHALELRRDASHVRNPITWEPATKAGLRRDHADNLRRLLDVGYSPERSARITLGIEAEPPELVRQAWYSDPHCDDCPGDGWITTPDNAVTPCACRRAEPYLATIHQLHGETA